MEKMCYTKYSKDVFRGQLDNKEDCIHHKLAQWVDDLEDNLQDKYGTRVILYFKGNKTTYLDMCQLVLSKTQTKPNFNGWLWLCIGGV